MDAQQDINNKKNPHTQRTQFLFLMLYIISQIDIKVKIILNTDFITIC